MSSTPDDRDDSTAFLRWTDAPPELIDGLASSTGSAVIEVYRSRTSPEPVHVVIGDRTGDRTIRLSSATARRLGGLLALATEG